MSAPTLTFQVTDEAKKALASLDKLPANILEAIRSGMDFQNQLTVGHIQKNYLSFPKQGPTTLQGLRVITNRLRGSLRASKATIQGQTVQSGIGTNVKYAGIHEFGGDVQRVKLAGTVRLRTDAKGNLLRQGKNGKLAVFAKDSHKRAVLVPYSGGTRYTIHYPARAPIQRGINDQLPAYKTVISGRIVNAFNN